MTRKALWGVGIVACLVVLICATQVLLRQRRSDDKSKSPVGTGAAGGERSGQAPTVQPGGLTTNAGPVPAVRPSATQPPLVPPRPDAATLSPAVRAILGLGAERTDAKARQAAIKKLTTSLSEADILALAWFLKSPYDKDCGVPVGIYNTLRNDVLEVLVRQEKLPFGLGGQMAGMYRDRGENDVWRDYSLQYMADYYERRWPTNAPVADDEERKQMLGAYQEALQEKDKTMAGTALIGLETLSQRYPEVDRGELAGQALKLATDEQCSAASRITAMRMCAKFGARDVLPSARIAAQTGEIVPLRMAAIATLGDIGGAEDLALLQSLSGSDDAGIKRIADAAQARLRVRLGGTNATTTAAAPAGGST
jgi:hypothetical protein